GTVYLTGAGPGDPGLLTLRAVEVLKLADLVLYDGLANPLLLRYTDAVCERTARTRVDSRAIVPQEEVNQRLIDEARSGKCVVRLKGGDPYIFGRGSEEAAALEAAGVPYEVVPGITAATAAAEYAGFSFTHRSHTSAVAFVTGHEDPTKEASQLDYEALASFPGTLVFYMGLGRLSQICAKLIENGKDQTTPAAIICQASLPTQRVIQSTLQHLPDEAALSKVRPPSLIVVGECVNLRQAQSWFEKRSLHGLRIGITCAEHQNQDVIQQIIVRSGQPIVMPMLSIHPVTGEEADAVGRQIDQLKQFDWLVFTSSNGVTEFFRHLHEAGLDSRALGQIKIAAVGPSTANSLKPFGLTADIIPSTYRAEALADALKEEVAGKSVLWAKADRARDVLAERLLEYSAAQVQSTIVYKNEDVASLAESTESQIRNGEVDWIGLSSPSAARRLAALMNDADIDLPRSGVQLAAISSLTAVAAEAAGLVISATATDQTWNGILQAIENHHRESGQKIV
ncbi:UNVERIFIED_CONTAM: hypothetical protein GTU68_038948, partial [Idotea baltica]|nr:hypothetical protein [Idotea baltica]